MRSIITRHFRQADIILLVFDLSERASFEALGEWLAEIDATVGPEGKVFVVGNKADLQNRAVSKPEGMAWALFKKHSYFETSALKDEGLKELSQSILDTLAQQAASQPQLIRLEDGQEEEKKKCC